MWTKECHWTVPYYPSEKLVTNFGPQNWKIMAPKKCEDEVLFHGSVP